RKIFCQKAFIFFRIPALTTALSKDSEISRIERIATIPKAVHPPKRIAATRPAAVTANDQPKVFRTTGYPIVLRTGSPAAKSRLYETLTPKSRAIPRSPDAYP